jgi:multiple sugar transport system ATP-binding protein
MIYVTHDQIEAMTLADRIAIMKNGIIQQLDTPHAVYNHPVNLFVAGFIGSPTMNFFKGKIAAGNFAMENLNVPLGSYKFEKPAGSNLEGVLGVRPEHIAVGEDAKKMPFQLESEIEIVEPMGSETVAYAKVGGQSLTLRCSSDIPLEPGQKVMLGFDPARGSVFDAQSGVRL